MTQPQMYFRFYKKEKNKYVEQIKNIYFKLTNENLYILIYDEQEFLLGTHLVDYINSYHEDFSKPDIEYVLTGDYNLLPYLEKFPVEPSLSVKNEAMCYPQIGKTANKDFLSFVEYCSKYGLGGFIDFSDTLRSIIRENRELTIEQYSLAMETIYYEISSKPNTYINNLSDFCDLCLADNPDFKSLQENQIASTPMLYEYLPPKKLNDTVFKKTLGHKAKYLFLQENLNRIFLDIFNNLPSLSTQYIIREKGKDKSLTFSEYCGNAFNRKHIPFDELYEAISEINEKNIEPWFAVTNIHDFITMEFRELYNSSLTIKKCNYCGSFFIEDRFQYCSKHRDGNRDGYVEEANKLYTLLLKRVQRNIRYYQDNVKAAKFEQESKDEEIRETAKKDLIRAQKILNIKSKKHRFMKKLKENSSGDITLLKKLLIAIYQNEDDLFVVYNILKLKKKDELATLHYRKYQSLEEINNSKELNFKVDEFNKWTTEGEEIINSNDSSTLQDFLESTIAEIIEINCYKRDIENFLTELQSIIKEEKELELELEQEL